MAGNRLQLETYEKMKRDCTQWLRETAKLFPNGISHRNALTTSSFTNRREITRDIMAQKLCAIVQIVNTQIDYVAHLEGEVQQLKSDVIEKQQRVIGLQEGLIAAKNEQLSVLKDTVVSSVSSVGDTVKTQLKTYSEAIQESGIQAGASLFDQNTLKTVVKDVVAEEDRSRNLVIFGLPEDPAEQISDKVGDVLQELGEKPKLEAVRIGLKSKKQTPRPVKVSVSNSTIVMQILGKARNLRVSDRFKQVFISPDRTLEQRAAHRELVEQLKTKKADEPEKHHYIKGGQICSVDKTDKIVE